MKVLQSKNTIIACSTGTLTNTAIAVIRISGSNFLEAINTFFIKDLGSIEPNRAYFTKIINGDQVLDEVVITFFKGPKSYNGEDILEISVHGNQLNIARIIDLFVEQTNIRRAEPGEFSYRAFLNKKMSLTQVEGLDLLLNAKSIFSLDQGFSLLSGKLQDDFNSLYESFKNHKSAVEFGFDFLEDMGEEQYESEFKTTLEILTKNIDKLHSHVNNQGKNIIKPEVVIYGLPNSGKSTLFNQLLNEERAIVTDIAGTTRDFIREDIQIKDAIFTLIDTAGIRETVDIIEEEGIQKGIDVISKSFFKVLLVNPFEFNKNYYKSIANIKFDLILFTHSDIAEFQKKSEMALKSLIQIFGPMGALKKFGPIEPEAESGLIKPMYLDLKSFDNSCKLNLFTIISTKYLKILDFDPILIERHANKINYIYSQFENYKNIASLEQDMAIISSELNIVGHCISELIGIISPDDVLHNIFDNFCIGK